MTLTNDTMSFITSFQFVIMIIDSEQPTCAWI